VAGPSYSAVAEALRAAGSSCGASEAHGGLCGSLCAAGPLAAQRWLADCMPTQQPLPSELHDWCDDTWRRLSAGELDFEPLMPDGSDAFEDRVQELAVWCHGFLAGLGCAGVDLETGVASEQVKEIIEDFVEISRTEAATPEDPESAEYDLAELVEYVRVGVQLAFDELEGARTEPRPTVH
jgi:uncharacterized protein YgfB (UPF0149 family)